MYIFKRYSKTKEEESVKNSRLSTFWGNITIVFSLLLLIAEIATIAINNFYYEIFVNISNGQPNNLPLIFKYQPYRDNLAIIYYSIALLTILSFITWFSKAYFSLNNKISTKMSPQWSFLIWFIPGLNLFKPYQLIKELFLKYKYEFEDRDLDTKDFLEINYLRVWWILFLLNIFVSKVNLYCSETTKVFSTLMTTSLINIIVGFLINIPLILITIKIVSRYNRTIAKIDSNI